MVLAPQQNAATGPEDLPEESAHNQCGGPKEHAEGKRAADIRPQIDGEEAKGGQAGQHPGLGMEYDPEEPAEQQRDEGRITQLHRSAVWLDASTGPGWLSLTSFDITTLIRVNRYDGFSVVARRTPPMSEDAPIDIQEPTDDRVASLCRGVAHPHRIAILRGIRQDHALTQVAAALDLSRSGVQTHVDTLVETDLAIRTGDQQDPYRVTVLGDLGLQLIAQIQQPANTIEEARRTAAAQAADELGDAPLPDTERERAVRRRTWELVADTVAGEDLTFPSR